MSFTPDRRTLISLLAAAAVEARAAEPFSEIQAALNPAVGPPMASVGLISRDRQGRATLRLASGVSDGPAGARPFGLDQPFRVASVSKMIAASVILPILQRRGIRLDVDVSSLLGFRLRHPATPDRPITPRMLLSHTSGLKNGPSYPVPLGAPLSAAFLAGGANYDAAGWFQPHPPGAWFAYADVNFALLAQIAERLEGERFDRLMHRRLFQPLGLDIGYNWSGVSARRRSAAAAGLRWNGGQWAPQVDGAVPAFPEPTVPHSSDRPDLRAGDYRIGDNGFIFSPQGGLRLSIEDMDRLARVFADQGVWKGRRIVSRRTLALMQRRVWAFDPSRATGDIDEGVFQGYGLGTQVPVGRGGPQGDAFFGADTSEWRGHLGDAYGWMTGLFWNLRTRETLVWAVNGMPETGRPPARRSSLSAPEEALVDLALARRRA